MKQEILEEAQRRFFDEMISTNPKGGIRVYLNMAIEFGAKWQQERSYSEEELIILLKKFKKDIINSTELGDDFETLICDVKTDEWFEQFKKK